VIPAFRGEYRFLSNFYPSTIAVGHSQWPTAEHLFQARKTLDEGWQEKIRTAESAAVAKRLGREAPLREDWESIKYVVMEDVLRRKFINTDLSKALTMTGNRLLVEGNTWCDQVWGSCQCDKHVSIDGQNALGIILMRVRLEAAAGWPHGT